MVHSLKPVVHNQHYCVGDINMENLSVNITTSLSSIELEDVMKAGLIIIICAVENMLYVSSSQKCTEGRVCSSADLVVELKFWTSTIGQSLHMYYLLKVVLNVIVPDELFMRYRMRVLFPGSYCSF